MKEMKINLDKFRCSRFRYNFLEVKELKRQFLKKKPIPLPIVNDSNKVIAFYSSYFVLKELKITPIVVAKNN
jgi:hypothetical protein